MKNPSIVCNIFDNIPKVNMNERRLKNHIGEIKNILASPYEVNGSIYLDFFTYFNNTNPKKCILCGRCVHVCQFHQIPQ